MAAAGDSEAAPSSTGAAAAAAPPIERAVNTSRESDTHKLQRAWVMWELRANTGGPEYQKALHPLATFTTAEGFWRAWNNLPAPSAAFSDGSARKAVSRTPASVADGDPGSMDAMLGTGTIRYSLMAYCLFVEGVEPMWEDAVNQTGGELFARQHVELSQLDTMWEAIALGMIGESLEDGVEITGGRVVDKSMFHAPLYRLEVWFSTKVGDRDDLVAAETIGQLTKRVTNCLADVVPRADVPRLKVRSHAV